MDVEIRPASPEDVNVAASCIYSSGPATFDYVFSHRTSLDALAYLNRLFRARGGEFGYGCHVVVTLPNGEVAGTGACYSGRDMLGFTVAAFRQIVSAYGFVTGIGVIRRGLQAESVIKPPKAELHYVAHIGVVPDHRGRGIGQRLVAHLLDTGRREGRAVAALDVSVENPRAEALYRRMGFEVTEEIPSNYANSTAIIPAHRRMELRL